MILAYPMVQRNACYTRYGTNYATNITLSINFIEFFVKKIFIFEGCYLILHLQKR
jgi:hypothetical protein